MRDPKRIEEVLNVLRNVWYEFPDLRLGQLLINTTPPKYEQEIYYIEDDEMIKNLKAYKKKYSKKYSKKE